MSKNNKFKHRNPICYDLRTNGLYKLKVEKNKKKEVKKFNLYKEIDNRYIENLKFI